MRVCVLFFGDEKCCLAADKQEVVWGFWSSWITLLSSPLCSHQERREKRRVNLSCKVTEACSSMFSVQVLLSFAARSLFNLMAWMLTLFLIWVIFSASASCKLRASFGKMLWLLAFLHMSAFSCFVVVMQIRVSKGDLWWIMRYLGCITKMTAPLKSVLLSRPLLSRAFLAWSWTLHAKNSYSSAYPVLREDDVMHGCVTITLN